MKVECKLALKLLLKGNVAPVPETVVGWHDDSGGDLSLRARIANGLISSFVLFSGCASDEVGRISPVEKKQVVSETVVFLKTSAVPGDPAIDVKQFARSEKEPEVSNYGYVNHDVQVAVPDNSQGWQFEPIFNSVGILADMADYFMYFAANARPLEFPTDLTSGDGFHGCPLVIDTWGSQDGGLQLSSQENGIWFDIFGENAWPQPHAKSKISWFRGDRYQFLVLPKGQAVNGVDQLFGNNTLGPDGGFAPTGYHALAKYDGTDVTGTRLVRQPDSYIDRQDEIFHNLRLWNDKNRNGESEPGELTTLAEAGITRIDLNYDPSFFEEDPHGNQAIFKSVVQFEGGRLGLMTDIWFRVGNE